MSLKIFITKIMVANTIDKTIFLKKLIDYIPVIYFAK